MIQYGWHHFLFDLMATDYIEQWELLVIQNNPIHATQREGGLKGFPHLLDLVTPSTHHGLW